MIEPGIRRITTPDIIHYYDRAHEALQAQQISPIELNHSIVVTASIPPAQLDEAVEQGHGLMKLMAKPNTGPASHTQFDLAVKSEALAIATRKVVNEYTRLPKRILRTVAVIAGLAIGTGVGIAANNTPETKDPIPPVAGVFAAVISMGALVKTANGVNYGSYARRRARRECATVGFEL